MNEALRDRGILDVIGMLSSQRASGALQVNTGLTEGALFFDRGQLVDAWLGKLTGFRAINALASVPDASFNFDPAIAPPAQSSITASERLLLKDFFRIDTADPEQSHDVDLNWTEDDAAPSQVVPLASVEPEYADEPLISKDEDEATLVIPKSTIAEPPPPSYAPIAEPLPPPSYAPVAESLPPPSYAPVAEPRPPLSYAPVARSRFRPALLLVLLAVLAAAAAIAFLYRSRKPDSTASITPAAAPTATPIAEVSPEPKTETAAAVPNLSGNWKVVNTVEQTSYEAYKNMEIGFNVSINQAGKDFTGRGEKISENGRSLPAAGRTPIEVKGTIDGDKVEATFSESGAVRKTNGRFIWRLDKGSGGLTGTFVSTAARTRGKSAAKKML
jgi:Domain of unknown function (DUF4388)